MSDKGYKILIVEDELLVAADIEESLESTGYIVQNSVDTAKDAIAEVEKSLPDLILMDINLKGEESGIYAAKEISKHHNVPIIFLTANSDMSTIDSAKGALPYGYIIKPFTDKELETSIEISLFKFKSDMKNKLESEMFNSFLDIKDHDKEQLIIQSTKGLEKINIDQVYYIEAAANTSIIHLIEDEIVVNKSLAEVVALFPNSNFIKVSKQFVINKSKVFVVKYPEIIISDKMSVITVDEDYKHLLDDIVGELSEIVDED
ncbi:MAG: response regulator [Bacteroidales bacterium]|nr:response regulator [Bacteroidales bacterium]